MMEVGHAAVLKLQWERRDMQMEFWCEDLKERDHLEHLGVDGRIILDFVFKELWIGYVWLRILISDRLLCAL
jgi:hypothetical protein